MDWRIATALALILWGVYTIPGTKAGEIHGEKVSFVFETAAFVLISILVMWGSVGDFQKVTRSSFINASLMGLMSAAGFYFLLMALRLSPANMPVIVLTAGMYPVITVVATHFLGEHLSLQQWLGVALAPVVLTLINWK